MVQRFENANVAPHEVEHNRFVRENGVVTGFVHDTHQTRGLVFVKQ